MDLDIRVREKNAGLRDEMLANVIEHFVEGPLSQSGPGCSKLATSLVNETLHFQTLILKYANISSTKHFSVFGF